MSEHALLAWFRGRVALNLGDVDGVLEWTERAIDLARTFDDADVEALAIVDRGHALIAAGRVDEGLALMDEANAAAMSGACGIDAAGTVYCSSIWSMRNIGDWRRASEWTDASMRWCERNAVTGFPGLCRFHRAEVLRMRGSFDDAERDALEAVEDLHRNFRVNEGWAHMELGEIRRRRGAYGEAEAAFQHALELGHDPQPGYALLRLAQGDTEGARAMIERALGPVAVLFQEQRVLLLPHAVTIALAAGDTESAEQFAAELASLVAQHHTSFGAAALAEAQGRIALAKGANAAAIPVLHDAWQTWCDADAPFEAAIVRVLLADAHQALGDRAGTRIELEAATAVFARLGADGEAQAAAFSARASPRPSPRCAGRGNVPLRRHGRVHAPRRGARRRELVAPPGLV